MLYQDDKWGLLWDDNGDWGWSQLWDDNSEEELLVLLQSIDYQLSKLNSMLQRLSSDAIPLSDDDAIVLRDSAHDSIDVWEERKENTVFALQWGEVFDNVADFWEE